MVGEEEYMRQPYAYPMPQATDSEFYRFRIDGSDILEELQHQLRGEIWQADPDGNGGQWVRRYNQEMTEEGINEVLALVYTMGINKNITLGCLEKQEVYERCQDIWQELANYFILAGNRIGLDRDKRSLLLKKIVYMIHSGLTRSINGREATQLSSMVQRIEQSFKDDRTKNSSTNVLASLFRRKR
jgi:hypothetical protein